MSDPLTIVTVCSYNRARSVMAQLLLQRALDARKISATVIGAGFNEAGLPPLDDTVRALRKLGLDASEIRSRHVEPALIDHADLVLTAEQLHVVRVVDGHQEVFAKSFTLPEFARRIGEVGPRNGRTLPEWLAEIGEGRTPATFLDVSTPEIDDPAGRSPRVFNDTATRIDAWCRAVAAAL